MISSKAHLNDMTCFRIQDPKYSAVLKHILDTRWASLSLALSAMRQTFSSFIEFLEIIVERENNSAKANGLLFQIKNFHFLFFIYVLDEVF